MPAQSLVDPHAVTTPGGPASSERENDPASLVGRTFRHFRIDGVLGVGGMGVVYRAFDTSLDRPVALKLLLTERPDARARFLREARAQAKIRHPGVVPIHFVGEDEGYTFIAMDLIEGESLASLLDREKRLPVERALALADAVAQALDAAAEQGLVHRDVKPSNILVDRRGHYLLADFGLAKKTQAGEDPAAPAPAPHSPSAASLRITMEGSLLGTPAYMAPEQAAGEPLDLRADIYSLGVTLFEAITGKQPFTAPTYTQLIEKQQVEEAPRLGEVLPDVRPEVEALVERMMKKLPEERFGSYAELRAAIGRARIKPQVTGGAVPRAVAFLIDLIVFIPVFLLGARLGGFVVLLYALVAGLIEGQFGTSLGKRLMNLRIVGPGGAQIGRGRALARALIHITPLFLVIGAQTFLKEGPLQRGISSGLLLLWVCGLLAGLLRPARATLHDRLTASRVVYALDRA